MSKYVITIDQGTTSSRVIIFDERGNIIYKNVKAFKQYYPYPNYVLHDALEIYEDVVFLITTALYEVNIDYSDIIGVGITNQRETTVAWNKKTGQPIYKAIVWQSTQTNEICEKLKVSGYEKMIKEKTGLLINPYFSASKMKWIIDNVSGAKELMDEGNLLFGTIDSWLIYKLCGGIHVTDYTNASRTMLFNIHTLDYDDELLKLFKINRNTLPKVVSSNATIGNISEIRIKEICNLEVCGLIGDQESSLIGHTCFEEGMLKITYGTGSFMLMNTGKKIYNSKNGLLSTIAYAIDDEICYALEGSVFVAGSAFQFIRDNLELVKDLSDSEFAVENSNGVVFIPALTGLGAPYWNSECKGAIFGLTRGTSKENIAWATIEGVAYLNKDVMISMLEDTKLELKDISVDGGASLNSKLMQVQADVMYSQIKTISTSEATSLGVFYLVGLNKGLFNNLMDIKKHYKNSKLYVPKINKDEKEKYDRWKKAVNACMEF